jgi:hypothetical protein
LRFTDTRWCPSGVSRRDVDAGIDVRVAGEAAGGTAEPGLAVARVLVDPPTDTAAQAGVSSPDRLHPARRLVLRALDQQTPALGQDRPVQAGLSCNVPARVPGCPLGRPGHVLYPQVLETDQVEPPRQVGGDLLAPVLTPVGLPGTQPGYAGTLSLLPWRAFRRPGLAPLGLAQPGPFPARHARAMQFLARRQRRSDHHTPVDPDRLAGTRGGDRLGNHRECDVPPPGMVKIDAVGLALWYGACPPEPHPADLGTRTWPQRRFSRRT